MRIAVTAVMLAGCIINPNDGGDDYYDPPPQSDSGWGSGWGGSGGTTGYGCHADSECPSSYVCARDGNCLSASSVRIIHVNWTVKGQVASDATCIGAPKLDMTFADIYVEQFGFTPVPCNAGRFTVDKMPTRYISAQLSRAGDYSGGAYGSFDATGNVMLDLPY